MAEQLWIDVLTPGQALFARALQREANKCVITYPHNAELESFISKIGLNAISIGGGGDLRGALQRQIELSRFAQNGEFQFSISFLSIEASRVSFGLGVPHFTCLDSRHNYKECKLCLPISEGIFTPYVIPKNSWGEFGKKPSTVVQYRATEPWAWVAREQRGKRRKTVFVMMDELSLGGDSLREFVESIPREFDTLLFSAKKDSRLEMNPPSEALLKIKEDAALVIGGAATAVEEAALLGIPNIVLLAEDLVPDVFQKLYIPKRLCATMGNSEQIVRTSMRMLRNIEEENANFGKRAQALTSHFEKRLPRFILQNLRKKLQESN